MEHTLIYVAPDGREADSGDIDSPLATLGSARNRARILRLEHPARGIDIVLRGGVYRPARTLELLSADGGSPSAPLRIRAFPGERVVMSGARPLPALEPLTDPAVLEHLPATLRERLRTVSFTTAAIPPIDAIEQRGKPPIELYRSGRRLPLSRYPAEGWLEIEDVPQNGQERLHEGLDREKRHGGVPVGRHYGRFIYPGVRPSRWGFDREILLHGYWSWDWNDSYQTIERIDREERSVHLASPHHHYGYTTKQRFAFLNVLEEIDEPGKWCFHRESGRIYLWPLDHDGREQGGDTDGGSDGDSGNGYLAATFTDPFIRITEASHVSISGIEFTESLGSGIEVVEGSDIEIAGSSFTRLGDTAVRCTGTANRIRSCDFHDLASGGISISGGDRKRLAAGDNRVENNHVSDYSRWVRTYQHAISVDGVSNVVANNLIHDAPQEAIYFRGNEHLIEFNEIHTVTTETGDSGAIHTGRDWTWRGTILRFNFIHTLAGSGLHGAMGIYLDDFMSATTIYGNILYRAGRAAFIGGGRDNRVCNNLFIDCRASVHVDARGTSWAAYYFDGTYPVLFDAMEAMRFRESPYAERYPDLLGLHDDDPARPKYNRVEANIAVGGRWLELRDTVRVGDLTHERNYIAAVVLCEQLKPELSVDPYFLDIDRTDPYELITPDEERRSVIEAGGNIVAPDGSPVPLWRSRDFTVRREVAEAIGFEQIPFERIGLYVDEYRTTLPEPVRLE